MSEVPAAAAPVRQSKRVSALDLDAMTVPELTTLIAAAEAKRQEKQDQARAAMLAKWRAEAAEAGLSFEALMPWPAASSGQGRKPRKDAGGELPVKYRGPNGEEWSGRGRLPKWVQAIEADGKSREDFKA